MQRLLLLAVCLMLLPVCSAHAGLKVFYLRHAESGANVEYQWKGVPRAEWPPYVGNADTFSPRGESQLPGVAEKLGKMHFDFIASSPLWRARQTVLPYLRTAGRTAEIWPELAEFHALAKDAVLPDPLPPAGPDLFGGGGPVVIPPDETDHFRIRAGAENLCRLGEGTAQQEADRRALTARVIELLRARAAGGDGSVLLVGHGNAGMLLAAVLTDSPGLLAGGHHHIRNATLWMAEEQADGSFRLVLFNDEPWAVE
jgi:broad specificity phosphatase PhoE